MIWFSGWSLICLFLWGLLSGLGSNSLGLVSILFWLAIPYLLFRAVRDGLANRTLISGVGIFIVTFGVNFSLLQDLFCLPSNDDTINHLAFLDSLLRSGNIFLGNIFRPGAEWFSESPYAFYPTGAVGLVAIWFLPFFKLGLPLSVILKISTLITLSLWPTFLWLGSKKLVPTIPTYLRIFLVVCTSTLGVFPWGALMEGAFPRILAQVMLLPFWFTVTRRGFLLGLLVFATLSFIHPSVIPLIGLLWVMTTRDQKFRFGLGLACGAGVFLLCLKTAAPVITDPNLMATFIDPIANGATGWIDRLKGPFHYWFTDPLGFWKFLSPKNFLIYAGIVLAIFGKLSRVWILFLMVPFGLSSLALIPHPISHQLGMIFYHSVKRISELTPFLGFFVSIAAASFFANRHNKKIQDWRLRVVFLIFAFLAFSHWRSGIKVELDLADRQFYSATNHQIEEGVVALKHIPNTAKILIDDHHWDALRFVLNQAVYTLRPECQEVGQPSEYCRNRRDFARPDFPRPPGEWWRISKELPISGLQVIEMPTGSFAIQLPSDGQKVGP